MNSGCPGCTQSDILHPFSLQEIAVCYAQRRPKTAFPQHQIDLYYELCCPTCWKISSDEHIINRKWRSAFAWENLKGEKGQLILNTQADSLPPSPAFVCLVLLCSLQRMPYTSCDRCPVTTCQQADSPPILLMFTSLPLDFLSRGRNTLVTSTVPKKFTAMHFLKMVMGMSSASIGKWKTPALLTTAHSPGGRKASVRMREAGACG